MSTTFTFCDKGPVNSARAGDVNGYFSIEKNPLTRTGVFEYLKKEIGFPGWEQDPDGKVFVLRHPDDVASEATLASLRRKPIIILHTMARGGAGSKVGEKPLEDIGPQGTTGDLIEYDPASGVVFGSISIWTATGQQAIDKLDIAEISLGYKADMILESGEFQGKRYDARQVNIIYNHIALVPAGRMGSDIRVLDHAAGGQTMTKKVAKWKVIGKSLGLSDSVPRNEVLAKHFGLTPEQVLVMDAKSIAHLDAEAEEGDGSGGSGGSMTIEEMTAAIKQMMPLMAQMQKMMGGEKAEAEGIAAGEGIAGAVDGDDPMQTAMRDTEKAEAEEMKGKDMEPAMMDSVPLRNATGAVIYKPKGVSFADAKAKGALKVGKRKFGASVGDSMTAAQIAALAEKQTRAVLDAAAAKSADTQAVSDLARRASPLIGVFDSAGMTLHQAAAYVLGKLDSGNTAQGAEAVGYVNAMISQRKDPAPVKWADAAPGAGAKIDILREAGAI